MWTRISLPYRYFCRVCLGFSGTGRGERVEKEEKKHLILD